MPAWPSYFLKPSSSLAQSGDPVARPPPFGGVKASGLGREGGPHSLDFYTESRIVHVPLADTHVPRFGV